MAEMEREDDDDGSAHKRKPWGETFHFCPVALSDNGVLWPGNQDTAVRLVLTSKTVSVFFIITSYIRYCDRLYYFSSEEAKEKFAANPLYYIGSVKVCVVL